MIIFYLIVHLNMFLVSVSSSSDQVHQTPRDIYSKPGEPARIQCSHQIQSYDQILWYKKSNDNRLQLLGYVYYKAVTLEDGVNVKLEGGANKGDNCTLIIERVNQSSSAVYFCAASFHSAACHCSAVQKPPLHLCSSNSDKVDQTPRDIFIKPGKDAKINFKQTDAAPGIYVFNHLKYREDVKVKMEGDASKGENCTLIIERVNQSSSAVYFCAASLHSAACHCSAVQKPPLSHFYISALQLTAPTHTWNEPLTPLGRPIHKDQIL
nr:uncharacterized protein LOC114921839 [Labrus bergylta]